MRHLLKLHPHGRSQAVSGIAVEVTCPAAGLLVLHYRVSGDLHGLVMPALASPVRTDGLWRHTCFEAFLGGKDDAYDEFNFAPSGQWAAYRFDAYRQGMRPLDVAAPNIAMRGKEDEFELVATFHVDAGASRLGLSAVIEEAGGPLSHWALAHPPGKPDFHHTDCFAAEVPAMGRP